MASNFFRPLDRCRVLKASCSCSVLDPSHWASASFKSLSNLTQLLGDGSLPLGASGVASATPELKSQLDKTNKRLTELAELGAVFVVSVLVAAEVPTISFEKRLRYKKVGPFGEKEKARLNSLHSELSEVSIAVTKAGVKDRTCQS